MKINSSEQLNELFTALAKAQAEMPIVGKNKSNSHFKYKYADFAEVVDTTRPSLTKHGLSVIFPVITDDTDSMMVCRLTHSSGQWIEGSMRITPQKNDIQSIGSAITYLKRYMYSCMTGCITADEDDDGERAMADSRSQVPIQSTKNSKSSKISGAEVAYLESRLKDYPQLKETLLKGFNINNINDLTSENYQQVKPKLDSMISSIDRGTR